jgi:integrase
LTDLAVERDVAESTQDQAFHAILYLFKHVLDRELNCIDAIRSSKPKRIPTVMSHAAVAEVLAGLQGVYKLMGQLMYGAGLRLSECLQLRVKDIDFDQKLIIVRDSKGKKDRVTPLPKTATLALRAQLEWRRSLHERDLAAGTASVALPHALDRKYPHAYREYGWQFVFASHRLSKTPRSGRMHRHHLHEDTFPDNLKPVVSKAGMNKPINVRKLFLYNLGIIEVGRAAAAWTARRGLLLRVKYFPLGNSGGSLLTAFGWTASSKKLLQVASVSGTNGT